MKIREGVGRIGGDPSVLNGAESDVSRAREMTTKKRGKVGRRSEGDLVQAYAEVQVRDVKVIAQCLKNDRLTPHDWMIKVS